MDDAALFDSILTDNKLGPRFDGRRTPTHAAEVERFTQRARDIIASALPKFDGLSGIFVAVIEDSEFNAWATRVKDLDEDRYKYCIGIHGGLLSIVNLVVNRMLADPRTFPTIGNPRSERDNLPLFSKLAPNATECNFVPVRPQDWRRELYAVYLSHLMFDFIIAHEVTHIGHGHVGYTDAEYGLPFVRERRWLEGTPEGNLESLAMEMDADFKAAELAVLNVRRLVGIQDQLPKEWADYYSDPARAMFDVAAAISIQSRMFGDTRLFLTGMATEDHPPDSWRQLMVLNVMGNYAERIWGEEVGAAVMASINRAITEVEEAIERLTGRPQQVQGLHDVWHGDGWHYAAAVTGCWNGTLRAKLAKYSFVEPPLSYSFDRPAK
jgi:hypothetical protein